MYIILHVQRNDSKCDIVDKGETL